MNARSATPVASTVATIIGYVCACPMVDAPSRPAVVLDPFGGTGTVAGVARALGRTGVAVDLSQDYCRLAQWFLRDGRRYAKAASRTDAERQGSIFDADGAPAELAANGVRPAEVVYEQAGLL